MRVQAVIMLAGLLSCLAAVNEGNRTIQPHWNDVLPNRLLDPGFAATIKSRELTLNTCIYDAWAAYDEKAVGSNWATCCGPISTSGGSTGPLLDLLAPPAINSSPTPPSPTQVPNETFFALPLPPQPSGSFSGLGYSNWRAAYGSLSYLTIGDGGPNQGYTYFTSNFSWTNFDYRYEINPDLENTGSTFYQAQCGNYNATTNPNGFISGADLLTQTRRHEYNSSTQSHYAFYSVAVSSAADNPGDYIEQQIAVPGADLNTFNTNVQSGITSRFNDVSSAVSHEDPPWPVNYNENNIALGNINYAPYTACQ